MTLGAAAAAVVGPLAAAEPPAAGAALDQVLIATAAAALLTAALLHFGLGHRSGRSRLLGRAAAWSERVTAMPGWLALPSMIAGVSLLTALFGMYWDISLHIDRGRDDGPLANPAHYFILAGLFGVFTAGFVAMVLPQGKPSAAAVRLGRDWWAPLGGVLICACGAFSLLGFPLDDVWHRLFGQDVTLWGPTHLMLIGGATMTLLGMTVLTVEGLRAKAADPSLAAERPEVIAGRAIGLMGGLLIGLSTFQAEFDFGVPQFRLVFQPVLLMVAAGLGLVVARMFGGRGAALGAAVVFVVVRGALALIVGPALGETTPHLPLYLAEAVVVEALALWLGTARPLRFGLASGVAIGTVGLAAEWGWSQAWMPLPWGANLFPEGAVLGFAAALAGALLGAWVGARLQIEPPRPEPALRAGALLGAAGLAAIVLFCLHTPRDTGISGHVTLREVPGGDGRQAIATIDLRPADAARRADWFDVTAWQGGGLVLDRLEEVGPGRWRTRGPIPLHGNWKAMFRLHEGASLTALPIYLPRDAAIPVDEIPAPPSFTRPFGDERKLLQRERRGGSPALAAAAYATVAGIALALLALIAWALHRLAFGPGEPRRGAGAPAPVGGLRQGGAA